VEWLDRHCRATASDETFLPNTIPTPGACAFACPCSRCRPAASGNSNREGRPMCYTGKCQWEYGSGPSAGDCAWPGWYAWSQNQEKVQPCPPEPDDNDHDTPERVLSPARAAVAGRPPRGHNLTGKENKMSRHYHQIPCRCGTIIVQRECTQDNCGTPQINAVGYLSELDFDNKPKLSKEEEFIFCPSCTFAYRVFWNM
jgi:hypothetical protein